MIYIKGIGNISPFPSISGGLPQTVEANNNSVLNCLEPDYTQYINPGLLRRMARIIKMNVAASNMALADAGHPEPDAIITTTGLGCIEDTNQFLESLVKHNETLLSPTAFIKSTHNTMGGQIALLLKSNAYNMTYAHRQFSFESGLLDALLQLHDREAQTILLGGTDELTAESSLLLQRLGCVAREAGENLPPAGEGAAYFVLTTMDKGPVYAAVEHTGYFYAERPEDAFNRFFETTITRTEEVDLVLTGAFSETDLAVNYIPQLKSCLPRAVTSRYKHLCGHYHTASAFGCWLAAWMLKEGRVPEYVYPSATLSKGPKNILIYNRINDGHAFVLLNNAHL